MSCPDANAPSHQVTAGACALAGALPGLAQDVLGRRADLRFEATGASMRPFIRSGDVVTVAPGAPRLGEVAAWLRAGEERLVLHRVVGRSEAGYLTRGDNCGRTDGYVPAAEVLGVVRRVERGGREVRLGLGPERLLLAALSRQGLLQPVVRGMARLRERLG